MDYDNDSLFDNNSLFDLYSNDEESLTNNYESIYSQTEEEPSLSIYDEIDLIEDSKSLTSIYEDNSESDNMFSSLDNNDTLSSLYENTPDLGDDSLTNQYSGLNEAQIRLLKNEMARASVYGDNSFNEIAGDILGNNDGDIVGGMLSRTVGIASDSAATYRQNSSFALVQQAILFDKTRASNLTGESAMVNHGNMPKSEPWHKSIIKDNLVPTSALALNNENPDTNEGDPIPEGYDLTKVTGATEFHQKLKEIRDKNKKVEEVEEDNSDFFKDEYVDEDDNYFENEEDSEDSEYNNDDNEDDNEDDSYYDDDEIDEFEQNNEEVEMLTKKQILKRVQNSSTYSGKESGLINDEENGEENSQYFKKNIEFSTKEEDEINNAIIEKIEQMEDSQIEAFLKSMKAKAENSDDEKEQYLIYQNIKFIVGYLSEKGKNNEK
jgi:hypothetical protein